MPTENGNVPPGAMNYSTKTIRPGEGRFPLNFWSRGVEETPPNSIGCYHYPWFSSQKLKVRSSLKQKETEPTIDVMWAERYWWWDSSLI